MPALFQDERDVIVKKFNQLGAYCGAGMGLASYAGQAQLVEFQPSNPLARFKVCHTALLLYVCFCVCVHNAFAVGITNSLL